MKLDKDLKEVLAQNRQANSDLAKILADYQRLDIDLSKAPQPKVCVTHIRRRVAIA